MTKASKFVSFHSGQVRELIFRDIAMNFREARIEDIWHLHTVRNSVKENILSDPDLVMYEDYEDILTVKGKGYVCEIDGRIIGFAIADLTKNNIWALFVQPEYEGNGLGRKLHDMLMDWYFSQTQEKAWLSTEPDTRASRFYEKAGWHHVGSRSNGEIKFEMTSLDWMELTAKKQVK